MGNSCFAKVNGIKLHYLDYPGEGQPIMLTHGLTANAWSLDPLASRLSPRFHVVVVDCRGRGLSDKPATGYTLPDIAGDILALMDTFGIKKGIVGGHSSGGLVTMFMAATYPERVSKAIFLDAGITHPNAASLLAPTFSRLGKVWPSWDSYLDTMKHATELGGNWNPEIEAYYRADVQISADGTVSRRASTETIQQVMAGQNMVDWLDIFSRVKQPSLLVNAPGPLSPDASSALIPKEQALQTVALLPNCRYVEVPGNHYTMLFNVGVNEVTKAVIEFMES